MSIDFNAAHQHDAYTGRDAQDSWIALMASLVDARNKNVADIGCGGAVYSRAWVELGAKQVAAIDSSKVMLEDAQRETKGIAQIKVLEGEALASGLANKSQDIVFQRALIHHLSLEDQLHCFAESYRVLAANGVYIIQDRTQEDVRYAGSPEHIRGYLFECFPRLLTFEAKRRPTAELVKQGLKSVGFRSVKQLSFWEDRLLYPNIEALQQEFSARKGRSILHELTDAELEQLIAYISPKVTAHMPLMDKDSWTIWVAQK
ncbi:class I SAM-dependent methyltransferase [Pseudomonas sp. F1_0610]|uniref:class I SAM-dependent methyltransferase n=1 Tax=Pseudomonas sp. F1_0610 TaxID=3114284 RepID=UPI0039C1EB81